MLNFTILIALFFVYLSPVFLYLYFINKKSNIKKEIDLFSPPFVITFFKIISIPYLFQLSFDKSYMDPQVLYSPWINDIDLAIVKFMFIEIIAIVFLILGYYSSFGVKISNMIPLIIKNHYKVNLQITIIVSLIIGLILYFYFTFSIGGLNYLWENMHQRVIITQGTGYLSSLYQTFLSLYLVSLIYYWKDNFSKPKYIIILINLIIIAIIFSSTGRRGLTISLLLLTIFSYHYLVKRIRRIPIIKTIIIGVFLTVFIAAIPLFRTAGSFEYYQHDIEAFKNDVIENIGSIPSRLSNLDRHIVTFSYFSVDKLWLGKSYVDLFYAPIPRKIYQDKPPVDEGVYFKTIVDGREVSPSLPAEQLSRTSWPPGTIGIMYANFWIPGIIIGMFLTGVIYRSVYNYMIKSNYSIFSIMIYFHIMYDFGLSNHEIVNTLIKFVFLIIISTLFFKVRFTKDSYLAT